MCYFPDVFSTNNNIGVMNNISLTFNPFPLLTQRDEIDDDVFCHAKKRPAKCHNPSEICFCLHRIKVKLNSIVEMVFSDESEGELSIAGSGDVFDNPNCL